MKLRAVENKARLAMALFVVALFLVIGLSLALYSRSRQELVVQRLRQVKVEAALLAAKLPDRVDDAALARALQSSEIAGSSLLLAPNGEVIARASTLDRNREPDPSLLQAREAKDPDSSGPDRHRPRPALDRTSNST